MKEDTMLKGTEGLTMEEKHSISQYIPGASYAQEPYGFDSRSKAIHSQVQLIVEQRQAALLRSIAEDETEWAISAHLNRIADILDPRPEAKVDRAEENASDLKVYCHHSGHQGVRQAHLNNAVKTPDEVIQVLAQRYPEAIYMFQTERSA